MNDLRRWGDIRFAHAPHTAALLAAAVFVGLLFRTRSFDFDYDEWDFVLQNPRWTLGDYFLPHNEHWSTIPMLVWRAIFAVQGAHSHLPFMAAMLLAHCAASLLLFALVRRRGGDLLALFSAALLLLLGRGSENIVWAFQVGFDGSVAFGLGALLLIDRQAVSRGRALLAGLALLASLMCSGVGTSFLAATAAALLISRRWSLLAPVLAIPTAAYLAWFAAIGVHHVAVHRSPFSSQAAFSLISYVPYGIGSAVAGLLGLGMRWSEIGFGLLTGVIALAVARGRRPDALLMGCLAGLVVQYTLIGLVRAQFGDFEAASPRYVYIAATFLLPLLTWTVRDLPWAGWWRPALVAVAAVAICYNAYQLEKAAVDRSRALGRQKAELEVAYLVRGAPGVDRRARIDPVLMPQVTLQGYLDSRAIEGSALPVIDFDRLPALPPEAVDTALTNLFPPRQSLTAAGAGAGAGCARLDPAVGYLDVTVPDGGAIRIDSQFPGRAAVSTWFLGGPPSKAQLNADLPPGESLLLHYPPTGENLSWHVRVVPPPYGWAAVCPAATR